MDCPKAPKLTTVSGDANSLMYRIGWSDGTSSQYPFVWLQDNCRCVECYEPACHQRLLLVKKLDLDITPHGEEILDGGATLKVRWSNGHTGEYQSSWLRQHQFDKGSYDPIGDVVIRPWGSEMTDRIPRFKYDDVMESDDALYKWLVALCEVGLAVLEGAPTELGVLKRLGERVCFLMKMSFCGPDKETFKIYPKIEPASVAYGNLEIGPHNDYPPGPAVQMLHCITQTRREGGENQFSDAHHAALILREKFPESYHLLKTVKINHRTCGIDNTDDRSAEYHYIKTRPVIEEDSDGIIKNVFFNNQLRAPYMGVPVDTVRDIYVAIKRFHDILYEHAIENRMKDGDIATFSNCRVLHGRAEFETVANSTANNERERLLEGAYLEWDEVYSRVRVLREKMDGEMRL